MRAGGGGRVFGGGGRDLGGGGRFLGGGGRVDACCTHIIAHTHGQPVYNHTLVLAAARKLAKQKPSLELHRV